MMRKSKKEFWLFAGSVGGIFLGGWLIFKLQNLFGFIPAIVGVWYLLKERK